MKSLKNKMSIDRFNQASAPNEIINFLKYFSQPSPADGKLKMAWGPVNISSFYKALTVTRSFLFFSFSLT